MTRKRYWAVVKRGKIVVNSENHLRPLLIFDRKWLADNARWSNEKIVEVRIKERKQ